MNFKSDMKQTKHFATYFQSNNQVKLFMVQWQTVGYIKEIIGCSEKNIQMIGANRTCIFKLCKNDLSY